MLEISNSWPVWLIATAVVLTLIPGAAKGLAVLVKGFAVFVPPLRDWIKAKEARDLRETREDTLLGAQIDNEKFNLQQDNVLIMRLLGVTEQTLTERAKDARDNARILKELEQAINQHTKMIERIGEINRALNGSIAGLTDRVMELGTKMASLQWYMIGNNRDKEGAGALEREQRRRGDSG